MIPLLLLSHDPDIHRQFETLSDEFQLLKLLPFSVANLEETLTTTEMIVLDLRWVDTIRPSLPCDLVELIPTDTPLVVLTEYTASAQPYLYHAVLEVLPITIEIEILRSRLQHLLKTKRYITEVARERYHLFVGEFVRGFASELNLRLRPFNNHLEELLHNGTNLSPKERVQHYTQLVQQSHELTTLTEDWRNKALIYSNGIQLQPLTVPLKTLIHEAWTTLGNPSSKLIERFAPDLPPLVVDSKFIPLILRMLLENAQRYSRDPITIEAIPSVDGTMAQIFITHSGNGIKPQHTKAIFARQYNLFGDFDNMAFIRYIVELHGGKLWLENDLGRDKTVHFTLPLAKETAS